MWEIMVKEYIIIDGQLYKRVDYFNSEFCPFCGSKELIINPEDETFLSRVGCLNCDRWIDPVRLRK